MSRRRCAGCGRTLRTSPGPYGPTCARKLAGSPPDSRTGAPGPRLPTRRHKAPTDAPTPPRIPGQTELPLTDHQPTLWSL